MEENSFNSDKILIGQNKDHKLYFRAHSKLTDAIIKESYLWGPSKNKTANSLFILLQTYNGWDANPIEENEEQLENLLRTNKRWSLIRESQN